MTQYLMTVNHADDYDPSTEEITLIGRDVDALNEELKAAGVMIFGGGLEPSTTATTLRLQEDGEVVLTDGPYLETKEHIGGFWVIEATDLDTALAWAEKAAAACRIPVELRPFQGVVED